MFGEDAEKLDKVTQPSIFIHSFILSEVMDDRSKAEMVAGHSLGEFSALVAAGVLSYEDGLNLVKEELWQCKRLVIKLMEQWQPFWV